MENQYDFLKRRKEPGVIILDMAGIAILYLNEKALELFPDLTGGTNPHMLPAEVTALHSRIRDRVAGGSTPDQNDFVVIYTAAGPPCSVRGIPMGQGAEHPLPTHVMLLVENIAVSHTIDFEKAQGRFGLTKRETEVLRCICDGLSNREISEKLFISEHTAKDHMKNILRKMGTKSRSGIVALLR